VVAPAWWLAPPGDALCRAPSPDLERYLALKGLVEIDVNVAHSFLHNRHQISGQAAEIAAAGDVAFDQAEKAVERRVVVFLGLRRDNDYLVAAHAPTHSGAVPDTERIADGSGNGGLPLSGDGALFENHYHVHCNLLSVSKTGAALS
jgi:hypothetical protein